MAIKTQGTLVEVQIASTWTEIGEITNFDGPGGEAGEIDTTHMRSTARQKLLALPDEGDFSFDANLVTADAGQVHLRGLRYSQAPANFRVTLADDDSTTLSFTARVKGFSINGGVDDKVNASISLAIDGEVVWA